MKIEGEGIIITSIDQLPHYLRLMTHQLPIESRFIEALADHLNAEVVLGTVTDVDEASKFFKLFKKEKNEKKKELNIKKYSHILF